jgi:hypothetical protein
MYFIKQLVKLAALNGAIDTIVWWSGNTTIDIIVDPDDKIFVTGYFYKGVSKPE